MAEYQSLYRKYRPSTFDKVIGQEHIVTTLVNQIKMGTIAHAYLLTGTRGTGKTSVARIFARAINCINPQNGSPCGECEVCRRLQSNSGLDVIEIDAASNNSVDDARALRDSVRYAPVDCKYKVYIIDEVHQLSTAAFNALLKTLEEPPAHAVFILATTEVQKIPATIMSRCLRLDFHLVPQEILENHIATIFEKENVKSTVEGISAIARAGEGSVRDTLSVADMCLSYATDIVDYNCVLNVLGANDPSNIAEITAYALAGDLKSALSLVETMSSLGKNMALLAKDISRYLRDLMIIKSDVKANEYLKLPDKLYQAAKIIAEANDQYSILRALEIFSQVESAQRYSTQPKIVLETAIIKCATLSGTDFSDILTRLASIESKLKDVDANSLKIDYSSLKATLHGTTAPLEPKPNQEESVSPVDAVDASDLPFDADFTNGPNGNAVPTTLKQAEAILPSVVREELNCLRGRLAKRLRANGKIMLYLAAFNEHTMLKIENNILTIVFEKETDLSYCDSDRSRNDLMVAVKDELGFNVNIDLKLFNKTSKSSLSSSDLIKLFGGAQAINIKK